MSRYASKPRHFSHSKSLGKPKKMDHKGFGSSVDKMEMREPIHGNTKAQKVLEEYEHGTLRTSNGTKVTNRKQAIAIALSEQRAYEEKQRDRPLRFYKVDAKRGKLVQTHIMR